MLAAATSLDAGSDSFWSRYRAMFNKRGNDWWSIVFGYPLARLLVLPIIGFRWITPNVLTVLSFACKLAAAYLLLSHETRDLIAVVVILQANTVLDSMDGTLARARKSFSKVGALLDKITDAIGLFAILAAVGWRAAEQTGEAYWIVIGCAGGAAYLSLCYMHWVVEAIGKPRAKPSETAGVATVPSWRQIGAEWLAGWLRIVNFAEADLYFWVALFAVLGHFDLLAALVALTQAFGLTVRVITHCRTLAIVDAKERDERTERPQQAEREER